MMYGNVPAYIQNTADQNSTQGDLSTLTGGGGGNGLRTVININEDQVLMNLLKKVFDQKIRSHCKFISDIQILTFTLYPRKYPKHSTGLYIQSFIVSTTFIDLNTF